MKFVIGESAEKPTKPKEIEIYIEETHDEGVRMMARAPGFEDAHIAVIQKDGSLMLPHNGSWLRPLGFKVDGDRIEIE